MINHQTKLYLIITAIFVAVILLTIGIFNFLSHNNQPVVQSIDNKSKKELVYRHPLSGLPLTEDQTTDFFAINIMFDNAYDARPQYGLEEADIVYEALAEGNITRLLGVFDSHKNIEKIGPVRSARPYFMDFASEYGGVYMHVGGSPEALASIDDYDFYNVDQIGAGEIYFWRDTNLLAPHNVFTSSSNWLRVGEIKEIPNIDLVDNWLFVDDNSIEATTTDFKIDYNQPYQVEWKFNDNLGTYLRWQGDEKFIYATGEQTRADNIIVQVVDAQVIDDKLRRNMDTQEGGQVFIFNKLGEQLGNWQIVNGRTKFFDEEKNELKLVAGHTWIQIILSEDMLITE